MATVRQSVLSLLKTISEASCRCPSHSHASFLSVPHTCQHGTETTHTKEYAFEMACSNIRYGEGVTKEVGMDLKNMQAGNVAVFTDTNVGKLPGMKVVMDSLSKSKVNFKVFDRVRVEPNDTSFMDAIKFARSDTFDAYLAVGGGSVMDTCKAANLYATDPKAELLDYVNAPTGRGLPVMHQLKPMIAVPTTSGTGSETTGVAVFDHVPSKAKIGIANRALRPTLGIVDPLHSLYMPERVVAYSGFDVLCHAMESYTAIPYNERTPCPTDPKFRPAYQGSNPISDIWSVDALRIVAKYMKRSVYDSTDKEARSAMHLASAYAGMGFGNAGVHLCHGLSYAIAGQVKSFKASGYKVDHPIIPHGLSVILTAPSVFKFTSPMCPERHLQCAEIFGADVSNAKRADAGLILSDTVRKFMNDLAVDDGLNAVGYTTDDIPKLVQATIPQERVLKLSPRPQAEEDLAMMFEESMKLY